MKLILLTITIFLASCLAFPNKRPLYITTNGKKQLKLVVKYSAASDNGECTYWLKGVEGSRVRGGLRIIDTIGRYSSEDTLILTLPR